MRSEGGSHYFALISVQQSPRGDGRERDEREKHAFIRIRLRSIWWPRATESCRACAIL
jgi:hypothetical protein